MNFHNTSLESRFPLAETPRSPRKFLFGRLLSFSLCDLCVLARVRFLFDYRQLTTFAKGNREFK